MSKKVLFCTVLGFLMICVLLTVQASGAEETTATDLDPRPGKIIWVGPDLSSADAHMWEVVGDKQIHSNYIESLVRYLGAGKCEPALATSWENSPDMLTWTFKLREGVKFNNGDSFTAQDVVWSTLRCKNMPVGTLKNYLSTLEEVVALDDYTVRFVFSKPNPLQLYNIFMAVRVYSKKQAERDGEKFYEKFVGTGPWKVVEWKPGQYFRFERNKDWYGEFVEGAPTMIEMRPIPEESTRIAALLTGEVDVVDNVSAEPMKLIEKSSIAYAIRRSGIECNDITMKNDRPPFNDSKLRQAMDYLVPRESIVKNLTGQGTPAVVWSLPEHPWFPEELKGMVKPFDKEMAKKLIAESNYKGEQIRLITRRGRTPKDVEIAELLAEIWKSVGLNVKVEVVSDSAYSQRRSAGDYEMFSTGWPLSSPALDYSEKFPAHQINRHKVDPKFNEMVESLAAEGDWDKFIEKTKEIERYLYQDPAVLHIWHFELFWGLSKRIQHLETWAGELPVFYEKTVLAPSARAK